MFVKVVLLTTLDNQLSIHTFHYTFVALIPVIADHIPNHGSFVGNVACRDGSWEEGGPAASFLLRGDGDQLIFQVFVPGDDGAVLAESGKGVELGAEGDSIDCVDLSLAVYLLLVFIEIFVSVTFETEVTCFSLVLLLEVEVLYPTTTLNRCDRKAHPVSETANSARCKF